MPRARRSALQDRWLLPLVCMRRGHLPAHTLLWPAAQTHTSLRNPSGVPAGCWPLAAVPAGRKRLFPLSLVGCLPLSLLLSSAAASLCTPQQPQLPPCPAAVSGAYLLGPGLRAGAAGAVGPGRATRGGARASRQGGSCSGRSGSIGATLQWVGTCCCGTSRSTGCLSGCR